MNFKILNKVLEELNNEVPDISYLRGMVETLLSLEEKPNPVFNRIDIPEKLTPQIPKTSESLNLGRTPNLNGIKDFVDKSLKIE